MRMDFVSLCLAVTCAGGSARNTAGTTGGTPVPPAPNIVVTRADVAAAGPQKRSRGGDARGHACSTTGSTASAKHAAQQRGRCDRSGGSGSEIVSVTGLLIDENWRPVRAQARVANYRLSCTAIR